MRDAAILIEGVDESNVVVAVDVLKNYIFSLLLVCGDGKGLRKIW
jgi:hypothetical protein